MDKLPIIVIVLLALVVGYLLCRVSSKRRDDIIKLVIKKDLLPAPAKDTKWIQDSICYMGDGTCGMVDGLYCKQISVN